MQINDTLIYFQQEPKLLATQCLICFIQKWFEWEPKAKEQLHHQLKKQQARRLLLKPESDQCYQKVATLWKLFIMKIWCAINTMMFQSLMTKKIKTFKVKKDLLQDGGRLLYSLLINVYIFYPEMGRCGYFYTALFGIIRLIIVLKLIMQSHRCHQPQAI